MHGAQRPAPRWITLLVPGLVGALLLACAIPGLSREEPAPTPVTATPQPLPSPTPAAAPTAAPGAATMVTTVTEEQMRGWLEGGRAQLGAGVEFENTRLSIRATGITISGNARLAQFGGVEMPVEIRLRPVVSEEHLRLEVLDVRLGGAYSSFSSVVKPLISGGIAEGLDVEGFLAGQGLRVIDVKLQDGSMVITSVPATP